MTLPLIAIVGPTASGKTGVGIELAERLGGEIISADAVAVYRGLDIGAAKPTLAEQARVPFHLIDVARPDEDFNVADFERRAESAAREIRSRGRFPILVGGTGLYVRAVTATLSLPGVPPQPEIRRRLNEEAEENGTSALHIRLIEVDAAAAAKILPQDRKRIIRALEVYIVTGQPLSGFHTPEGVHGVPRPDTVIYGLNRDRAALYACIEARVDAMLANGLRDEVQGLLAAGYSPALKSMQSLGYRHMAQHLAGQHDLASATAEMKKDTRRFAKRQLSWFRGDPQVQWLETTGQTAVETSAHIARRVESIIHREDSR